MTAPTGITADDGAPETFRARGDWRLGQAESIDRALRSLAGPAESLDAGQIDRLDSTGALLLLKALERLDLDRSCLQLRDDHEALVSAVAEAREKRPRRDSDKVPGWKLLLAHVGQAVAATGSNLFQLVGFLGLTLKTLGWTLLHPSELRITSTVHHMEQTGVNALPLVALLSFLVGAVIAFLGATVLRAFGAEVFVVDLTTYAFLREFGVLLTAILLAGRTASAFTAQIGTMKSREEIDAIRTLGLDPIVLLVIPRLMALVIMLPLLAVVAALAGLLGGIVVCATALNIPPEMFINRMVETMTLRHYLVGLIKAPIFALVIALVGCLEGLKVAGTAQSVGERTTSAVVQSISLVIILDALAAIFFMEIGW